MYWPRLSLGALFLWRFQKKQMQQEAKKAEKEKKLYEQYGMTQNTNKP